jgi:hypothetical protein
MTRTTPAIVILSFPYSGFLLDQFLKNDMLEIHGTSRTNPRGLQTDRGVRRQDAWRAGQPVERCLDPDGRKTRPKMAELGPLGQVNSGHCPLPAIRYTTVSGEKWHLGHCNHDFHLTSSLFSPNLQPSPTLELQLGLSPTGTWTTLKLDGGSLPLSELGD